MGIVDKNFAKQQKHTKDSQKRSGRNADYDTEEAAVRKVLRVANARADIEEQHGPVRVLFKDGKPVV